MGLLPLYLFSVWETREENVCEDQIHVTDIQHCNFSKNFFYFKNNQIFQNCHAYSYHVISFGPAVQFGETQKGIRRKRNK